MECQTDSESVHEVLHVIVPTHIISRYLSKDVRTGFTVPAAGREFRIAERLLQDIFEDVDELPEHIGQLLFESALAVLTDAIIGCENYAQVRDTVSGARLKDVLKFIELHLSDPKLSTTMVAEACGISQRYMSRLLNQNNTPFSVLVWDQRLKMAHRWLSTSKPSETTIAEIAFRVGFKSPAHFSRIFKQAYSCGPREFREERHARVPAGREVYSTDFVVNTIQ
jgi:AraC-like DNA-binding protein